MANPSNRQTLDELFIADGDAEILVINGSTVPVKDYTLRSIGPPRILKIKKPTGLLVEIDAISEERRGDANAFSRSGKHEVDGSHYLIAVQYYNLHKK